MDLIRNQRAALSRLVNGSMDPSVLRKRMIDKQNDIITELLTSEQREHENTRPIQGHLLVRF